MSKDNDLLPPKRTNFSMYLNAEDKASIDDVLKIIELFKDHLIKDKSMPESFRTFLQSNTRGISTSRLLLTFFYSFYDSNVFKKYRISYEKMSKLIEEEFSEED